MHFNLIRPSASLNSLSLFKVWVNFQLVGMGVKVNFCKNWEKWSTVFLNLKWKTLSQQLIGIPYLIRISASLSKHPTWIAIKPKHHSTQLSNVNKPAPQNRVKQSIKPATFLKKKGKHLPSFKKITCRKTWEKYWALSSFITSHLCSGFQQSNNQTKFKSKQTNKMAVITNSGAKKNFKDKLSTRKNSCKKVE